MEKISCLTIHLCRQVTNFIAFWFTLLVCVYFEKVNRCIYFLLLSYRKGHTLNFCPWLLAIQKYILEIVPFQCIDIFIFFSSGTVLCCVCVYSINLLWTDKTSVFCYYKHCLNEQTYAFMYTYKFIARGKLSEYILWVEE